MLALKPKVAKRLRILAMRAYYTLTHEQDTAWQNNINGFVYHSP